MTNFGTYFRTLYILLLVGVLTLSGCEKKVDAGDTPSNTSANQVETDNGNGENEDSHGHSAWMTDFENAKQVAKNEGKDLLVDFAGSDWCYWCKKLDAEVFKKDEFVQAAQKDFVLVLIDDPSDKSGQSQELQQQNAKLINQFNVQGFPTVLLMDAEGNPYAQTGYEEGGPKAYLAHLDDLKNQKAAP